MTDSLPSPQPPSRAAGHSDRDFLAPLLAAVRAGTDARLSQVIGEQRQRWASAGPAATEILDAAQSLLAGGKRMRAVLATVGMSLGPGASVPTASAGPTAPEEMALSDLSHGIGAVLELYQASALVHDDVIDSADLRRGLPTAHRGLETVHQGHQWLGDAAAFGASGAILLGDLLLSLSGEELGRALKGVEPHRALEARRLFDAMAAEVAVGQFLDMRCEALPLPAPGDDPVRAARLMKAQAQQVVLAKSARYSVMHPLLLGAQLAGVEPGSALYTALEVFGQEVGIAFQLRDDVLGVLGSEECTGKPVGDDLREGKRTVLVALTWERTDDRGRELLRSVLSAPEASAERIHQCTRLMTTCGALDALEAQITSHLRDACAALETIPEAAVAQDHLDVLGSLSRLLTDRVA